MPKHKPTMGLSYRHQIVGKHLFRVRETHLADHIAPLITRNQVAAAKLDLVLRGLALDPRHCGARPVGTVLPAVTWEDLHDLCRTSAVFDTVAGHDSGEDAKVRKQKRDWVSRHLRTLELMNLIRREDRPGRRPYLTVLNDKGNGKPLDDPDGSPDNSYVTIVGSVIASPWFAVWDAPELAAYLAAMIADRYARHRNPEKGWDVGGATWFQPLTWFSDTSPGYPRPEGHVAVPFSATSLQRGFKKLEEGGLVIVDHRTTRRPDNNPRRFQQARNVYHNRFPTPDHPEILPTQAFTDQFDQLISGP